VTRRKLTAGVDFSSLGRAPDQYDYREVWANRVSTFELMWNRGVHYFELDLVPTKDGGVCVTHDSVIDGKKAWEWTTAELIEKGVPELDALLDLFESLEKRSAKKVRAFLPGRLKRRPRTKMLVELKGAFSSEAGTDAGQHGVQPVSRELVERTASILGRRLDAGTWTSEQLVLVGFNHGMLELAKQLEPRLQIALSYAKESFGLEDAVLSSVRERQEFDAMIDRMISEAKAAGAVAIVPDGRFVDERLVKAAHENDLRVHVWTSYRVDEPTEELLALGVDTIISDTPLAVRNAERRQRVKRPTSA
jgi:glycerophosphoryl diester phosphodiesterase